MQTKSILRQQFLERRQAMSPADVLTRSEKITNRLMLILEKDQGPVCMFIGMPSKNEVNTLPVLIALLRKKRPVWCPVVTRSRRMAMAPVGDLTDLDDSHPWGLIQPKQELVQSDLPAFSVILVPGVVWDDSGYRIGYGKGYYDGFLSQSGKKSLKAGLAFQFQVISSVPADPWDVPVDVLITDEKVMETGRKKLSL